MSSHTFYRIAIWLPLAIPTLLACLVHGLGLATDFYPLQKVVQILLVSLVYGGVPYAPLAIWATWWVGGQAETTIKRLMMRAPLLMVAVFVPVSVLIGIFVGEPVPFIAVAVMGAIITIPVGYSYVGLVVLLRDYLAPPKREALPSRQTEVIAELPGTVLQGLRADKPTPKSAWSRVRNSRTSFGILFAPRTAA